MCSSFRVKNIFVFENFNYLENVDVPAGIRLLITAVLSYLRAKSVLFFFLPLQGGTWKVQRFGRSFRSTKERKNECFQGNPHD